MEKEITPAARGLEEPFEKSRKSSSSPRAAGLFGNSCVMCSCVRFTVAAENRFWCNLLT
jgi:hypothetical protein